MTQHLKMPALLLFLLLAPTLPLFCQTDSIPSRPVADSLSGPLDHRTVRGIERDERPAGEALRKSVNAALWVPRTALEVLMTTAGLSAILIDENNLIKIFEGVFYLHERTIGWFPVLNVVSGSPRGYGMSVFYNNTYFHTDIKGAYSNREIWGIRNRTRYTFFERRWAWNLNLLARINRDNDFRFYGVGNQPGSDPRSHFLPGNTAERGYFTQKRTLLMAEIGVRTSGTLEYFFTSFYQRRQIRTPATATAESIDRVFDVDSLPGFTESIKRWYSEVSVRYDSRQRLRRIDPGYRLEAYSGLALPSNDDENVLWRLGADVSAFIPILRDNRIIVPRVVFNMVEDIRDSNIDIPFTEYPRHPSFRGVSSKQLLRSDKYMLISSLDYQWPLTYHLSGHLFVDHLMVAPDAGSITLAHAPWAVGCGLFRRLWLAGRFSQTERRHRRHLPGSQRLEIGP